MPGLKLVGDIGCFATSEGWLYLAAVLDLCSKELIGYAIAPHMRVSLAIDAISAARRSGLVAGNAIMHTDRGSCVQRVARKWPVAAGWKSGACTAERSVCEISETSSTNLVAAGAGAVSSSASWTLSMPATKQVTSPGVSASTA
ncbi:MAG: DDE-type integrase/transposase/recombinase [Sciscionella sp.]